MSYSCPIHGSAYLKPLGKGSNRRIRCSKCSSEKVSFYRKNAKRKLVELFGGKCILCGYSKYFGSLSFHHLDPSKKDFGIAEKGRTISFERMVEEASKCILVCHNCHSEIHAGLIEIPGYPSGKGPNC